MTMKAKHNHRHHRQGARRAAAVRAIWCVLCLGLLAYGVMGAAQSPYEDGKRGSMGISPVFLDLDDRPISPRVADLTKKAYTQTPDGTYVLSGVLNVTNNSDKNEAFTVSVLGYAIHPERGLVEQPSASFEDDALVHNVTVTPASFSLAPRTSRDVSVVATVDPTKLPGSHYVGLHVVRGGDKVGVIEELQVAEIDLMREDHYQSRVGIGTVPGVVARLRTNIQPLIYNFEILNVELIPRVGHKPPGAKVTVRNTGNAEFDQNIKAILLGGLEGRTVLANMKTERKPSILPTMLSTLEFTVTGRVFDPIPGAKYTLVLSSAGTGPSIPPQRKTITYQPPSSVPAPSTPSPPKQETQTPPPPAP